MFNVINQLPINTTFTIDNTNNGNTIALGTHEKAYVYNYNNTLNSWTLLGNIIQNINTQSIALSYYNNHYILVCGLINSVKIYKLNNNIWTQLIELIGDNPSGNFGIKVKISGNSQYIICGESISGYIKIYKYTFSTNDVEFIQKISNKPGFGSSIDISDNGETIIFGNDSFEQNKGQVRIYSNINNFYTLTKLFNGIHINDQLGKNVAISADGNTIMFNTFGLNTVSIFQYNINTWTLLGDIIQEQDNSSFGSSLALAKNELVIAISTTEYLHNRGNIKMFKFDTITQNWIQIGQPIFGKINNTFTGKELNLSNDGQTLIFTTSSINDLNNVFINANISLYKYKLPDAKTLYDNNYSIIELQNNSYTIEQIFNAGYSISQLKDSGYTFNNFIDNGYTLITLKPFYTITELKANNVSNLDILGMGYNSLLLYNNGFTFDEIHSIYSLIKMKNEGITIDIFIDNNLTVRQLYDIGFTISEISLTNKYSYFDILEAGFTANELEGFPLIPYINDNYKVEPYEYYIIINNTQPIVNSNFIYVSRNHTGKHTINFDTIPFSTINLYDTSIDTSNFNIIKTSAINIKLNDFKNLFIAKLRFYSFGSHLVNVILQKYMKPIILNNFIEVFESTYNISFDSISFDSKIKFYKEFSNITLSYFRKKINHLNKEQLNDVIYSYEINDNKIYLTNEIIVYSESLQVGLKILFDFIVHI